MKAVVGMEVHVFTPEQDDYIGLGEIVRVEKLTVEETGEVLTENYPIIKLLDGREIGGLNCWWCPSCKAEEERCRKLKSISNGDRK